MKRTLCVAAGAVLAAVPLLAQGADAPAPIGAIDEIQVLNRELGASGDFLYGFGNVTLPIGFGLAQPIQNRALGIGNGEFTEATRKDAIYYGGTLSGSLGKTWFIDVSYSQGKSEGEFTEGGQLALPSIFGRQGSVPGVAPYSVRESFYQVYIKYAFPQLSGTRTSAYLRLGATLAEADASMKWSVAGGDLFGSYDSISKDYLGNVGFGLEYAVIRGDRLRMSLLMEGEGFGGSRVIEGDESLTYIGGSTYAGPISNQSLVYGALGRGVARIAWALDGDGRWRLNMDLGVQAKFLINEYDFMPDQDLNSGLAVDRPNVHGTEMLWGPYGRLGLSYSF